MPQNFISRLTGNNLNISIVGMTGSGKSAIAIKYLTRRYITEYSPYVSDKLSKTEQVDGQDYNLTISEYNDSDNLDVIGLLQWSNVVLIIFSITSRRSFYRAQELIESIHQATKMVSAGSLSRGNSIGKSGAMSENIEYTTNPHIQPTGTLKKSQATNIVTTQLLLISHKSDLERLRLVKKEEVSILAQEFGLQMFETTVTEEFSIIEDIFQNAIRIWNNKSSMPMLERNQKRLTKVFGRTSPTPKRSDTPGKKISTSSLLADFMSSQVNLQTSPPTTTSLSSPTNGQDSTVTSGASSVHVNSLPSPNSTNGSAMHSFMESVPTQLTNVFSSLKLKPSLLLSGNSLSNKTEDPINESKLNEINSEQCLSSDNHGLSLPPYHPKKSMSRFKFLKKQ